MLRNYNGRTGVILAAGLGTRLCNFTTRIKNKPLSNIDDITFKNNKQP